MAETAEDALQALRSALLGAGRYTSEEVARLAGADPGLAKRLWRAMGLADIPEGEAAFTEADLDALRQAAGYIEQGLVGPDEVTRIARVLGQATARIADSVIGLSGDRILAPAPGAAASGDAGSPAPDLSTELVEVIDREVVYLLNRHLLEAASRRLAGGGDGDGQAVAVGFADLVGFTRLSEQLSDTEIADLVDRFESLATDIVVANGGRVIKMIGDEVMFAAPPEAGPEIALLLAETFDSPDLPGVRVGLASGPVLEQAGDLFGPTVNLAARATVIAHPGSVLVSRSMFEMVEGHDGYSLRRMRPRRLKGIGFVELAVLQRASSHRKPGGRS